MERLFPLPYSRGSFKNDLALCADLPAGGQVAARSKTILPFVQTCRPAPVPASPQQAGDRCRQAGAACWAEAGMANDGTIMTNQ